MNATTTTTAYVSSDLIDSAVFAIEEIDSEDFAPKCHHAYRAAQRTHHRDAYIDTAAFIESLGL